MSKRFVKVTLVLVAINVAAQLVGRCVSRRCAEGGEDADEFRLVAITSGVKFRSRAAALREGRCQVLWGGAKIDLRQAELDPGGADLELAATMGGIEVRVPTDWRVEMDSPGLRLGGVELRVPPHNDRNDDAPALRVRATAVFGGIVVS